MSNNEKYQKIFEEIFSVNESELNESFNFKDIDSWDAFEVMFESDDILHFGGYMNGMEILKRYGVDFDE